MGAVDGFIAGPAGPWLAILTMALATYLLRIGGGLIMSRIRITPAVGRALDALPGSIVASTVVPIAIKAGPAAIIGVVTAVVVAWLTRSELAALILSLVVAAGARAAGL